MTVAAPAWSTLTGAHVQELAALAARVIAEDGGMPLAAQPAFLTRRFLPPGAATIAGRTPDGRLIAAGALRSAAGDGVSVTGLVDPATRGAGLGTQLMQWGLAEAEHRGATTVTLETESCTPAVRRLGFVTCTRGSGGVTGTHGRIEQLGVVASVRRRGLGTALGGATLRAMRAAGVTDVLLNVNNPAALCCRRTGFTASGRRASFQRPPR